MARNIYLDLPRIHAAKQSEHFYSFRLHSFPMSKSCHRRPRTVLDLHNIFERVILLLEKVREIYENIKLTTVSLIYLRKAYLPRSEVSSDSACSIEGGISLIVQIICHHYCQIRRGMIRITRLIACELFS